MIKIKVKKYFNYCLQGNIYLLGRDRLLPDALPKFNYQLKKDLFRENKNKKIKGRY